MFVISSLIYWVFGWFLLWRLRYCVPPRPQTRSNKSITIIIPARNEAHRLPHLLSSLKSEGAFDQYELILADDGSSDSTAALAEAAGCVVIKIDDKPKDAIGKSWACWKAAQRAKGELLLFLDADVWFVPGGLNAVSSQYKSGLMSVQPYHRFKRPYESLSAFFNLMSMAGIGSFTLASRSDNAYGCFGPCILCEKERYLALGGHFDIRSALVDDLALAKLFQRHGLPVWNYAGKGAVEYRMYPGGLAELAEGWTKNLALASKSSSLLAMLYFAIWCAGFATLGLSFFFPILNFTFFSPLLYVLYSIQTFIILRRIGNWRFYHGFLSPFYLVFFLGVLALSLVSTYGRKEVSWKGRKIKPS